MPNLRALTQDLIELVDLLDNFQGEDDTEIREAIQEQIGFLEDDLEGKTENIVCLIREKESMHKARMDEAERLRDMATIDFNTAQRLRDWLHFNINRLGTKKIETRLCKVSLHKNSQSPLKVDESRLPDEYMMTKTTIVPNKIKIKEDLKNGKEIAGVTEMPRGTHLRGIS
tara:strand:+ start:2007 stop:2519 length:513 start_codon:yes stop_codon:yes gene_type:complete